ncbi:MAG: DUF1127 domain-containing protein [Paracoccaceae bacterium]
MAPISKTARTGQASLPSLSRLLRNAARLVTAWQDRSRTRRNLANLDPHLVRDIGLEREAVLTECEKPFWRN